MTIKVYSITGNKEFGRVHLHSRVPVGSANPQQQQLAVWVRRGILAMALPQVEQILIYHFHKEHRTFALT